MTKNCKIKGDMYKLSSSTNGVSHAPRILFVDHTYADYSRVPDNQTSEKKDIKGEPLKMLLEILFKFDSENALNRRASSGLEEESTSSSSGGSAQILISAANIETNIPESSMITHHAPRERRNSGGVVDPFPSKLMEVLARDDMSEVISWLPHGRSFFVRDVKTFTEDVLPRFFRQSKFMSFTRQVNLWGFKRITRGTDTGSYYHQLFLRGKPSLLKRMRRTKIKCVGMKLTPNPDEEPNFYALARIRPLASLPPCTKPLPPLNVLPSRKKDNEKFHEKKFQVQLQRYKNLQQHTTGPCNLAKSQFAATNAICPEVLMMDQNQGNNFAGLQQQLLAQSNMPEFDSCNRFHSQPLPFAHPISMIPHNNNGFYLNSLQSQSNNVVNINHFQPQGNTGLYVNNVQSQSNTGQCVNNFQPQGNVGLHVNNVHFQSNTGHCVNNFQPQSNTGFFGNNIQPQSNTGIYMNNIQSQSNASHNIINVQSQSNTGYCVNNFQHQSNADPYVNNLQSQSNAGLCGSNFQTTQQCLLQPNSTFTLPASQGMVNSFVSPQQINDTNAGVGNLSTGYSQFSQGFSVPNNNIQETSQHSIESLQSAVGDPNQREVYSTGGSYDKGSNYFVRQDEVEALTIMKSIRK